MKKLEAIRVLLRDQVLSAKRLKLAKILAKEWLMGLPLLSKKSKGFGPDLPPDPPPDTWRNHETRAIDSSYFTRGTAAVIEDRILDDGRVHAEHEYTVQLLNGGISYTNQSIHRSIFTQAGERVELLSSERKRSGIPIGAPTRPRLPIVKTISGVTANLYGTPASADGNYYHWFVDTLSRLFLIDRFHSLDSIDQILVPPLKYDFHWDSLAAFGFDQSRIYELQPLECVQFERLLASSAPRGKGSALVPSWLIDRYNETLLEKAKDTRPVAGKRVYISRRDAPSRMFINEHEVCQLMENRGFDIVELTPLNLWEKIAVFRDADIIVSQTGAGLTNLMFCHSNVKVLELVDEKFVYPSYASILAYSGGAHHVHYFSNENASEHTDAMQAKSSLDIDKFEKSLTLIG